MPAAERDGGPITGHELASLFSNLADCRRVILAVSGGPDSTALLLLAERWRAAQRKRPDLIVGTVDHGLRPEAKAEAAMVAKLAAKLGLPHHILVWSGEKPSTGLQEAARAARYRLLLGLARATGADAIATAHTEDDQAETMLMRIVRGSGLAGLAGIKPKSTWEGVALVRPFLGVPKARLIATLRQAGVPFAEDPSNEDPRFTRVRLRRLGSELAAEGLDGTRLATLARRLARADAALEAVVDELLAGISRHPWPQAGPVELDAAALYRLPGEILIRLLQRAIDHVGDEGPVELGKLEVLHAALEEAHVGNQPLKRTLAGAAVSLDRDHLVVTRAPARKSRLRGS